jgi:aspartyl-tRNA(Asn)/glutamyl-tRNA(Gln) amidotransferase subunit B
VKNVNSFKFLQKALEFEIARQVSVLSRGERVQQETRLWDGAKGETVVMRSKEEAHDYRYFPEPDLPPLVVPEALLAEVRASLEELPAARVRRFVGQYGLSEYDANVIGRLLPGGARYFESVVAAGAAPKTAGNWIQGEVRRKLKEQDAEDMSKVPIAPEALAGLVDLTDRGVISSSVAKQVFEQMWATGRTAKDIVEADNLAQIGDESALAAIVAGVVSENPDAITQIKAGRNNVFGFLVGVVMKRSGGKANPKVVNELIRRAIDEA